MILPEPVSYQVGNRSPATRTGQRRTQVRTRAGVFSKDDVARTSQPPGPLATRFVSGADARGLARRPRQLRERPKGDPEPGRTFELDRFRDSTGKFICEPKSEPGARGDSSPSDTRTPSAYLHSPSGAFATGCGRRFRAHIPDSLLRHGHPLAAKGPFASRRLLRASVALSRRETPRSSADRAALGRLSRVGSHGARHLHHQG